MGQGEDAVAYARAQIGKPYVWAASGPNAYDCSGLTMAAYEAANPPIHITHFTGTQILQGTEVGRNDLQVGDLVFPDSGHVQLYSGSNTVIESPHSGATVREVPMYGFWRARRVAAQSTGDTIAGAFNVANVSDIHNPLDTLANIEKIAANFLKADFWRRIGFFVLAANVILFGIIFLLRHQIATVSKGIVNTAVGVGETAVRLKT